MITIGQRRVVESLLIKAASKGRHFSVVVSEGRPDEVGAKAAKVYATEPAYQPRSCWTLRLGT